MSKRTRNVAVLGAVGIAAGYLAGILTARKSGKETRRDIINASVKAKGEAEKTIKKLNSDLSDLIEQAEKTMKGAKADVKAGLKSAIDRGSLAKKGAREMLSALHEGEAVDQDLNNAISDAQSSVKNLKAYLAKKKTEK